MIQFTAAECRNLDFARSREWLVTNGIGGYASSTIIGMNTRRYHGLLVAATAPPLGRMVLLSHLDETLTVADQSFDLATNLYQGGIVHPMGYSNQTSFQDDFGPSFTWGNGVWELKKSVSMVQGQNAVVVDYVFTSPQSTDGARLEIRPLLAFRDFHGNTRENGSLDATLQVDDGVVSISPYGDAPRLYFAHTPATLLPEASWYRNFDYEQEKNRGLDSTEDLFHPFTLCLDIDLKRSARFTLIVATSPQAINLLPEYDRARTKYMTELSARIPATSASNLVPTLYTAAEQFIVARPPFKTIIAGYHWFGDWGRDTMIAMPGLLLSTGQPEVAKEILQQFLRLVDQGMLPNRFPDSGQQPEYNTVDATLWFFEAIRQYVAYREDAAWNSAALALVRNEFYDKLKEIVRFHLEGTRYGIHADKQGFLWAGNSGTQLTWMDARVGDVAITPRHGRPVEIQALWYNALRILADFAMRFNDPAAARTYTEIAQTLAVNFQKVFWNEAKDCLYDVAGDGGNDASTRPNQLFTISLHYRLLTGRLARQVVEKVEAELLTPFGLRTLSPDDPHYRGTYEGDVWNRDSAYHQGTVWPWLAGAFFSAKLAVCESPEKTMTQIRGWLAVFENHLREAGIGQISEIFDADPPHTPRGCIAQAWSVAEILRLAKLTARSGP